MKCQNHPNSDAVAQCSSCGAGVCKVCAENTKELRESCGILCLDCYTNNLNDAKNYYSQMRAHTIKHLIGKIVFYVIGLFIVITGLTSETFQMTLVGLFFCGIYLAISGWKAGKEIHEEDERKHGVTYYITEDGIHRDTGTLQKVVTSVLYCAFGLIATPIWCIIDSIKIKNYDRDKKNLLNEISRIHNGDLETCLDVGDENYLTDSTNTLPPTDNAPAKVSPSTPATAQHQNNTQKNNMGLLGFIFSLTSILYPILLIPGFICSIVGIKRAKEYNGDKKGLSIAGLIISIIIPCAFAVIIYLVLTQNVPEILL